MKTLICKSYPDGTLSVTRKRDSLRVGGPKSCKWDERSSARRAALQALDGLELAALLGIELGVGGGPPFPCQVKQKSVKLRNDRPVGLTKRGGKILRRAFASWETVTLPGTMAFGTLTFSDEAIDALLAQDRYTPDVAYQEVVSRYMERLRKLLKSRGLPGDVIWVTEMHPSRSHSRGMYVPHIHFVVQTALKKYQWLIKPSEISALWESAICAHVNVGEGKRFPSRCEIKCVKKSVSRYVAKYLRKSAQNVESESQNLDKSMVPARWYAVANGLHKLIKKLTGVIVGEEAAMIFDWLRAAGNPVVKRWGDIKLPGESGREVWIASWFILRTACSSDDLRVLMASSGLCSAVKSAH